MIFGSTKTKLDYILENGCRRIDEGGERIICIHSYPLPQRETINERLMDMAIMSNLYITYRLRGQV